MATADQDKRMKFLTDVFGFTGAEVVGAAAGAGAAEQDAQQEGDEPQGGVPHIDVNSNGDGSFTVTGSGFVPGAKVKVQVTDDSPPDNPLAIRQIWRFIDASGTGTINFATDRICKQEGTLHFMATDERRDPKEIFGNELWSNIANSQCPRSSGGGGGGDDPGGDDPGGGGDDPSGGGGGGSDDPSGGGGGGSSDDPSGGDGN